MIYFTSDLHLGHANAIYHSSRPFADVDEMNRVLIRNINDTVSREDTLWIIGDFAYRIPQEAIRELRKQIVCKSIHLVRGNHDGSYAQANIFQSVQDYKEVKTEYGKIVLFHYPILDWAAKHYGSIHLHGHIHSRGDYNEKNLLKKADQCFSEGHVAKHDDMGYRIYDVGVDANGYKPISLADIAERMGLHVEKQH